MAAAESDAGAVSDYRNLFGVRVLQPVDMDETQLRHAIETSKTHLKACEDWHKQGDEVVAKIKEEFDSKYGPSWHVVIGRHFGSKVTHDAKQFAFFYIEASGFERLVSKWELMLAVSTINAAIAARGLTSPLTFLRRYPPC